MGGNGHGSFAKRAGRSEKLEEKANQMGSSSTDSTLANDCKCEDTNLQHLDASTAMTDYCR